MNEEIEKKKQQTRKRGVALTFRVTAEEKELIERRMTQAGVKNLRAYLLKMSVDGQVVRIELDSVNEMVRLLGNATNNINQIARRVNQGGSFYDADLDEIKARVDEIWVQTKTVMRKIAAM
ncbi:mobilization protein [Clostridia bacterium]|nr:mobilization protein [Clostridia bacterium]